ncbi:hypothetical protein [Paenibacillus gorillae]|uniref:hypothetical protein n=1 Tax=Paenibacillus gorillae TaxID=1243662 RepID=UPI0005A9C436|nr:hypothetical protein [Paenibacillus gorillae]
MNISMLSRAALIAAFLCMFATGCKYTAAPADLLTKPSQTADKQALMKAVEAARPAYSKLTLPLRDDGEGAIRLVDLNGDGTPEAIVSLYNEYNVPELVVFRMTSGVWRSWFIIQQPMARQIDWIKIDDFDQNGKVELAIGWVGSFESPSLAEFYSFQSKPVRNEEGKLVLQPVDSIPYAYAEVGDVNGDGRLEIAIIQTDGSYQEASLPSYTLKLYNWDSAELTLLQQLELYDGVNAYDRMVIGRVSPKQNGIVVEASMGAHAMYTAMYAWENRRLQLVYPKLAASAGPEDAVFTETPVMSEDVNGDGIIELMLPRPAPGYDDLSYAETKWINEWMQWDGTDAFHKVLEEYSDYGYQIRFQIPGAWMGHYTVRAPDKGANYAIAAFEYWNGERAYKTKLADIYAIPLKKRDAFDAEWKSKGRSYSVLKIKDGLVYAVSFAEPPESMPEGDKAVFLTMRLEDGKVSELLRVMEDE